MCKLQPVETIEQENTIIEIFQDDVSDNPRDWDNLGHMVCFHKHYCLGDKHNFSDPAEFLEFIERDDVIALPLYLYDHSIQSISTRSFIGRAQHAEWDSGKVGYIYVTKEEACKEYGWKRMTPKRESIIMKHLESEVETYDDALTGNVYGYVVTCKNCDQEIDSCWGFFGNPEKSGLLEQAREIECESCKAIDARLKQLEFNI